jgi:hypothetical protein
LTWLLKHTARYYKHRNQPNGKIEMTNTLDQIFALIAQKHLFIETLETRNSDSLDFHDVSVWGVRSALEAAFKAGVELGASMPKPTESEIGNT